MTATSPSPTDADLLLIGRIVAPFGVRGQVKMVAITDRPEYLQSRLRTIFIGPRRELRRVKTLFEHKPGLLVVTFADLTSREEADLLRGYEVFIRAKDAAPLAKDEYFLHDLPGMHVLHVDGHVIGVVRDYLETGANEVLVVQRQGQADALIPMIHDVVVELDLAARRIVIKPLDGLL